MLDLTAAAAQVAVLARQVRTWEAELPARRGAALAALRQLAVGPLPHLPERERRWVAVPDGEPLDRRIGAGALPSPLTVLAVDGSQIEPDFHDFAGCGLINVGWALFRFDGTADGRAEMASAPTTHLAGSLEEPDAEATAPGARSTEVRRMLGEVERVSRMIADLPRGEPVVALIDGPLVAYWVLNLLDEEVRQAAVAAYKQLFALARDRGVALAGYISRSRSAEVTHLLRYSLCAGAQAGGPLCAACQAHFPRVGPGTVPCYAPLEGIADRHLFSDLLGPGERSACFSSGGGLGALAAAGHDLRFFYLRAGDDLARVEVPAWLIRRPPLLALLHAALLDQAALGQGYPLALCEAHEQAVVRASDRAAFFALLQHSCAREQLYDDLSPKLRTKRQPVG